jgi:hypothetical protein
MEGNARMQSIHSCLHLPPKPHLLLHILLFKNASIEFGIPESRWLSSNFLFGEISNQ